MHPSARTTGRVGGRSRTVAAGPATARADPRCPAAGRGAGLPASTTRPPRSPAPSWPAAGSQRPWAAGPSGRWPTGAGGRPTWPRSSSGPTPTGPPTGRGSWPRSWPLASRSGGRPPTATGRSGPGCGWRRRPRWAPAAGPSRPSTTWPPWPAGSGSRRPTSTGSPTAAPWSGRPGDERLRHHHRRWVRKADGSARLLEAPKRELKDLQRQVLHHIVDAIPAHEAAHGFRPGRSALTAAPPHAGRPGRHALRPRGVLRLGAGRAGPWPVPPGRLSRAGGPRARRAVHHRHAPGRAADCAAGRPGRRRRAPAPAPGPSGRAPPRPGRARPRRRWPIWPPSASTAG